MWLSPGLRLAAPLGEPHLNIPIPPPMPQTFTAALMSSIEKETIVIPTIHKFLRHTSPYGQAALICILPIKMSLVNNNHNISGSTFVCLSGHV